MLPRLQAQEALAAADAAALGSGMLTPGDARRRRHELERQAQLGRRTAAPAGMLPMIGIKVVSRPGRKAQPERGDHD